MKRCWIAGFVVTALLVTFVQAAEEALKSGPQVGQTLPNSFDAVNVTGPDVGEKCCIFCEYGDMPVAMVFAREPSTEVVQLMKKLDAAAKKHGEAMRSTAIFLTDDKKVPEKLKEVAGKEKLENTIVRTFEADGPKNYNMAKDADVTVLLFTDRVVKANHAFRKGKLQEKEIDAVVADVAKIVPAGK